MARLRSSSPPAHGLTGFSPSLHAVARPSRQALLLAPPPPLADAWAVAPILVDDRAERGCYTLPPRRGTRLKIGDDVFTLRGDADADRTATAEDVERLNFALLLSPIATSNPTPFSTKSLLLYGDGGREIHRSSCRHRSVGRQRLLRSRLQVRPPDGRNRGVGCDGKAFGRGCGPPGRRRPRATTRPSFAAGRRPGQSLAAPFLLRLPRFRAAFALATVDSPAY